MSDHEHDWEPVTDVDVLGQYRCRRCPATGYRNRTTKQIDAHRVPRFYSKGVNARPHVGSNATGHKLPSSGGNR